MPNTIIIPSHLGPILPDRLQARLIEDHRAKGFDAIHTYLVYGGDYGREWVGPVPAWHRLFNAYTNADDLRLVQKWMQRCAKAGLSCVAWLACDDHPDERTWTYDLFDRWWTTTVPQINEWASAYVCGLEGNEYWSWSDHQRLANRLCELTDKPVFVHLTQRRWGPEDEEGFGSPQSWWRGFHQRVGLAFQSGEFATDAEWERRDAAVIVGRMLHLPIGGANSGNYVPGGPRPCVFAECAPFRPSTPPADHLAMVNRRGDRWMALCEPRRGQVRFGAWDLA